MRQVNLQDLSVPDLVQRFVTIALDQDEAMLMDEIAKFNRLYDQMNEVTKELKARSGDQRHALFSLYDHPNAQVRLKAGIVTLGLAPQAARQTLQAIIDRREFPQAGDAGMTLINLDRGIFKPD